jgi:hypothetical protein
MEPPEPNKRMDGLLKSYSRKRREQAAPGFELHPATRQMLQEEVKRTVGKTQAKARSGWESPWWWRGLAVAGGLACVWFILVQVQMPAPKSQSVTQSALPHETPMAGMAKAKEGSLDESVVASDVPRRSILPAPASPAPVAAAAPPLVVSAAPVSSGDLSDSLRRESANKVESNMGLNAAQSQTVDKMAATKTSPVETLNFEMKQAGETEGRVKQAAAEKKGGQQFVQFDNRAQYRENVLSPPLPKVLTAFELARTGDKVRITDADGSVYDGVVLKPHESKTAFGKISGAEARADRKKGEASTNENYAFRVSGLNRNLKQKVVFTGNVMEGPSLALDNAVALRVQVEKASRAAAWGNAANQQSFQNNKSAQNQSLPSQASVQNNISTQNQQTFQNQPSAQSFRCAGRVRVGNSSEFPIEAVPVP